MKKLLTLSAFTLFSLGLFSCRGSYDCVCNTTTVYTTGNTESLTITKAYTGPRAHARANCKNQNMSYSLSEYTYTASCDLK